MIPDAATLKLTYADFQYFPQDGRRHELVDGEHFVTPSPASKHQLVLGNLFGHLWKHVQSQGLGWVGWSPLDVVLTEYDVLQPDLFFVSRERMDRVEEGRILGAPDLVIEALSPSTRKHDEVTKRRLYEKHGVLEYWIVDVELERFAVHRRQGVRFGQKTELSLEDGDRLSTPLLPGFEVALNELFAWP